MKILLNWLVAVVFLATVAGGSLLSLASPVIANATSISGNPSCAPSFLFFPAWYRGLTVSDSDCTIISPDGTKSASNPNAVTLSGFIWTIVLNIIDIGLQLVGYLSVFFIIFGGYQFLTSSGEAAGIANARKTILNAVIGLVISIASVAIVNLIFGIIK